MSSLANSVKYPHTRAILTSIAATFKQQDGEGTDTDQEGEEGQRINSALVSKVASLLQDEKEDELKQLLKVAFSIPDTVVSEVLDCCSGSSSIPTRIGRVAS